MFKANWSWKKSCNISDQPKYCRDDFSMISTCPKMGGKKCLFFSEAKTIKSLRSAQNATGWLFNNSLGWKRLIESKITTCPKMEKSNTKYCCFLLKKKKKKVPNLPETHWDDWLYDSLAWKNSHRMQNLNMSKNGRKRSYIIVRGQKVKSPRSVQKLPGRTFLWWA